MKYDDFEILYENWAGFQRAVHELSPCHPMKKFSKDLMAKIRSMPEEKQEEYFNKYFAKKGSVV
jgi:hypothetical protein